MNYRNNWRFPRALAVDPAVDPRRPRRVAVQRPFEEPARSPFTGEPRLRPVTRPVPDGVAADPVNRGVSASEAAPPAPARPAQPTAEPVRESQREPVREAELRAEIARLQALVAEKDQHAREAAVQARLAGEELERAKQRIRKDADREFEHKRRGLLLSFLDVLDDLDRALESARSSQQAQAVVEGVELVRKGFLARLAQFDVSHMPALGQRFDPGRHEALGMVPVSDPDQDGLVLGVVREGYAIGDQVLRPAAVAVGRYSPAT